MAGSSPAMTSAGVTKNTKIICNSGSDLAEAGGALAAGKLVAFPTETVYGLGADATNPQAVARIFAAKARPAFNPLISHVTDLAAARKLGVFDARAEALATAFWPGPLTLIVPALPGCAVCDLARAGLDTLAIRVPAHPIAQGMLHAAGVPVSAPSANRSGHVSPTTAAHVLADLEGRIDLIVDGGPTMLGLESSIFACLPTGVTMLRPGSITRAMAEDVIGPIAARPDLKGKAPIAPGELASHYAPRAALRIDAEDVRPGEALLAFGRDILPGAESAPASANLSPAGDLTEAASNLYAMLRALDAGGAATIAVQRIPQTGLGEAIADRLRRAAAPR